MTFLISGYRLSKDEKYKRELNDFITKYGAANKIINVKVTTPDDVDASDDELTFLPYFTWFWNI